MCMGNRHVVRGAGSNPTRGNSCTFCFLHSQGRRIPASARSDFHRLSVTPLRDGSPTDSSCVVPVGSRWKNWIGDPKLRPPSTMFAPLPLSSPLTLPPIQYRCAFPVPLHCFLWVLRLSLLPNVLHAHRRILPGLLLESLPLFPICFCHLRCPSALVSSGCAPNHPPVPFDWRFQ